VEVVEVLVTLHGGKVAVVALVDILPLQLV
jgi:hypothetical protein